jgi:hypothetical protein
LEVLCHDLASAKGVRELSSHCSSSSGRSDNGHAVVNRLHQFIGFGGDDGERLHPLSIRLAPYVPRAGEAKGSLGGDNEEVIVVMTCHIMAHVGPSNRGTVRDLQCKS